MTKADAALKPRKEACSIRVSRRVDLIWISYEQDHHSLHASYSYHLNRRDVPLDAEGKPARKSIKHAHFNEEWVMLGDMK